MSSLPDASMRRLLELAWVLQELMIDLKTAVDLYTLLTETIPQLEQAGLVHVTSAQPTALQKMSLNRFIIFPVINTLRRFIELTTAYGKEIHALPEGVRKALLAIKTGLEARNVYDFRNTYTAHALRKVKGETDRPLTLKESLDALARVTGMERSGSYFRAHDLRAYLASISAADGPCIVKTIDEAVAAVSGLTGGIPERSPND